MLRIIVRTDDARMAVHVGGGVHIEWRTFDVDLPEIEEYLRSTADTYAHSQVVGVEIVPTREGGDV